MKRIKILCLILILVYLSGCTIPIRNNNISTTGESTQIVVEMLPLQISKLPKIELSTIDNFEKFKKFADVINSLIEILNKETNLFNIPKIEPTVETWNKVSKTIEEYGPLVNNYNEVVNNAREYENNPSKKNLENFYIASGKFGFEFGVIYWAVFYGASYKSVGIVYRSVGLNQLAFKCPTCVKIILSTAHWEIRTILVEGSSQVAQYLIELVSKLYESGKLEELLKNPESLLNVTKNYLNSFNITI